MIVTVMAFMEDECPQLNKRAKERDTVRELPLVAGSLGGRSRRENFRLAKLVLRRRCRDC